MGLKTNILKILFLSLWILLGGGVLVLMIAAMNIKSHKTCKAVEIEIKGVKEFFFLDKKDIMNMITDGGLNVPNGKAIAGFNLHRLESLLEKNVWIKAAELFFDNNQVLHVKIMEREPVARIFSRNGSSFYIDSSGFRMPLGNKMTMKLPVFTGFPTERWRVSRSDSLLTVYIKGMGQYILQNDFWMAQLEQVDITPRNTFEMIPTVGNHIIEFGDGENYENKFRLLFLFYTQVLSKAGFDKYSRINVEYEKQVIGKKGMVPKIDSLKAMKNIKKMIEDARKLAGDSTRS